MSGLHVNCWAGNERESISSQANESHESNKSLKELMIHFCSVVTFIAKVINGLKQNYDEPFNFFSYVREG